MELSTRQRGFSLIIYFLVIFFLIILVIVGSYFYKINYQTQSSDPEKQSQTNLDSQTPITGKVIFTSSKEILSIADPDGKNIQPLLTDQKLDHQGELPPRFGGLSPDGSKILIRTSINYNPTDPNNPEYKIGLGTTYYIMTIGDKTVKKLDLSGFKSLGKDPFVTSLGWSADGRKFSFSAFLNNSNGPEGREPVLGDFDPNTGQMNIIYRHKTADPGYILHYDAAKQILVVSGQGPGLSDYPKRIDYRVDLKTQAVEEFKRANLSGENSSPYFISSDVLFESPERKKIIIYSYDRPNIPITEIKVEDPESDFTNIYLWSTKFNYLAIFSSRRSEDGKTLMSKTLNIYSRDGKKISSRDVEPQVFYHGGLFSPDESKLLLVGETAPTSWQVIDVKTGKSLSEKITSPDLGRETARWIK